MKANAETFWLDQVGEEPRGITKTSLESWPGKLKDTLRYFVSSFKDDSEYYSSATQSQKHHMKNEFFYRNGSHERKRILEKTWKRHSAFLVYRQNMHN